MQHLLAPARWDADAVRDDVRDYVTGHLGDPGAVLVTDETGDIKKGACTAGVQRQYSGTAGRIENCQVAVYLAYAAPRGHALIDRELYLPASWAGDRQRCRAAGLPEGTGFATKLALARRMIARTLDAGRRPAGWPATRSTAPTRACAPTCQLAPGSVAPITSVSPRCPSEVTRATPDRPRGVRSRKNASHPARSSLVVTCRPRISR
jgi:hypothetical protein